MAGENLWGDLGDLTVTKTPVAILREQAEVLSQSTRGLLIGEVASFNTGYSYKIGWELRVRVPAMNDYRATLIRIEHPITLYPINDFASDIAKARQQNVPNEDAFKELIKTVLVHPDTRKLLSALLSQAQG